MLSSTTISSYRTFKLSDTGSEIIIYLEIFWEGTPPQALLVATDAEGKGDAVAAKIACHKITIHLFQSSMYFMEYLLHNCAEIKSFKTIHNTI